LSTCLKLCRVSCAVSFKRRSTSGSRVTVSSWCNHDSKANAVKIAKLCR
jgi:hypothetical protein